MAKRRTRKEKERAKHQTTLSWSPQAQISTSEANVKRQFKNKANKAKPNIHKVEKAKYLAKDDNLNQIKVDIIKSFIIAGFLVSLEVVLYLALNI